MGEKISILVVDDILATRENIRRLLEFEEDMAVIGEAEDGEEAVRLAEKLQPDIVLMDVNMPGIDGIEATELIARRIPQAAVVIMSVQGEQEYLKKAMLAGAKEYLIKPFNANDLVETIRSVHAVEKRRQKELAAQILYRDSDDRRSRVTVICGTKGGVGKTVIAANLAISLQQTTKAPVALVDLDLQFGDIPVLLDLFPKLTIGELAQESATQSDEVLSSYMCRHSSGIHVLPAPSRPEYAEYVSSSHVEKIIKLLRQRYTYIIVDTPPHLGDTVLAAMDEADYIALITNLEMTTLRGTKLALEIMQSLGYSEEKVKVVLNRSTEQWGITPEEAEETLGKEFWGMLPTDVKTVATSVNRGIPFVLGQPKAPISQSVGILADKIKYMNTREKLQTKRGIHLVPELLSFFPKRGEHPCRS